MVKHFFLTCSVLLSAAAQTALAKEYDLEGLLVFLKNTKDVPACVKAAGRFDVWRFTTYEEYIQNLMFNDGFSAIMPKPQNEVGA